MYRIIDERGSGKTGRLFLLAKDNNGIIACANPNAMRVKAERYGIFGIDELEVFVRYAIQNGFMGYTLSKE